jgi:hypothetical protein
MPPIVPDVRSTWVDLEPLPAPEGDRVELGNGQALRTGDHAATVYWHPDELFATIVPYMVEGLHAGDKVVHVAHELTTDAVAAALESSGVDVGTMQRSGRLVLLRAAEAFFPGGQFDVEAALAGVATLAEQAAIDGYTRIRFSVDMNYLTANVPGIERGLEFEARANDEVFARYPFVCICSFDGSTDQRDFLSDILRTHPVLVVGGVPVGNPAYRSWKDLRADAASRERWLARHNNHAAP